MKTPTKTKMVKKQLKLNIELPPGGCSGKELWCRLLPNIKRKIERELFEKAGYRCEVCGTKGVRPGQDVFELDDNKEEILGTKKRVQWDEVWQYDDKTLVAKLLRLWVLCEECREVKNLGFTLRLLPYRESPLSRVGKHFCKINNVEMLFFWHQVNQAELECERRTQHKWEVDYGEYEPLVPKRTKRRNA